MFLCSTSSFSQKNDASYISLTGNIFAQTYGLKYSYLESLSGFYFDFKTRQRFSKYETVSNITETEALIFGDKYVKNAENHYVLNAGGYLVFNKIVINLGFGYAFKRYYHYYHSNNNIRGNEGNYALVSGDDAYLNLNAGIGYTYRKFLFQVEFESYHPGVIVSLGYKIF